MKLLTYIGLVGIGLSLQAQITLKKFDDPSLNAIDKIEFVNQDDQLDGINSSDRTFDVQANNPFNKLNFTVKDLRLDKSVIYDLTSQTFQSFCKEMDLVPRDEMDYQLTLGESDTRVKVHGNTASIVNNFYIYSDDHFPLDQRVSNITILDSFGRRVNEMSFKNDSYEIEFDSKNKLLFRAYNEKMAHSSRDLIPGFEILDFQSGSTIYREDGALVLRNFEMLNLLHFVITNRIGRWRYVLDPQSKGLYRYHADKISGMTSDGYFNLVNGKQIGLQDFERVL